MKTSRTKSSPTLAGGRGLQDDEIELGRVSGVFGVRGEVRLFLHNRETSVLLDGVHDVVLISPTDGHRLAATLSARPGAGKRILGRIEGVDDPDAARGLMEYTLAMATADLPAVQQGEFYVTEVEGLDVFVDEARVGSVVTVHETPGGSVFEIRIGNDEIFVPAVTELVLDVDVDEGRVVLSRDALDELP